MQYLIHSAKGSTWKKHKYIRKEGDRYIYTEKESLKDKQKKTTLDAVKGNQTKMKISTTAKNVVSSVSNPSSAQVGTAKKGALDVARTIRNTSGRSTLKTGKKTKPVYLRVSGKTYVNAPSISLKSKNRSTASTTSRLKGIQRPTKYRDRYTSINRGTNQYSKDTTLKLNTNSTGTFRTRSLTESRKRSNAEDRKRLGNIKPSSSTKFYGNKDRTNLRTTGTFNGNHENTNSKRHLANNPSQASNRYQKDSRINDTEKTRKTMSDVDYKKKRKRSRKSVTHDKTRPLSHK